jgi:hypothetical protein
MRPLCCTAALLLALAVALPAVTGNPTSEDGFVPLFNGKDLTGWVNVNCAPGTFTAKDGEIVTTGKPTGYLRTTKQYENFVAEFDWMHVPPSPGAVGNSGFFVWADPIPAVGTGYTRGIEVQVLVNLTYKNKKGEITATSQGDLFSIHGATCVPDRPHPDGWARCLPSGDYCKGEKEWNHYRVEANDGVIKLAVNGHVVSGLSKCKPRKGYLALESEGSECHFKNLKIKELPSTNPSKDEVADEDQGFKNLYTGLDLSGWQADDEARKHWQPKDAVLHYDGKGEAKDTGLCTDKEHDHAEFIVDFRFPTKTEKACTFILGDGKRDMVLTVTPAGTYTMTARGGDASGVARQLKPAGEWNRVRVTWERDVAFNGEIQAPLASSTAPKKVTLTLRPQGEMDFANLFVRQLK